MVTGLFMPVYVRVAACTHTDTGTPYNAYFLIPLRNYHTIGRVELYRREKWHCRPSEKNIFDSCCSLQVCGRDSLLWRSCKHSGQDRTPFHELRLEKEERRRRTRSGKGCEMQQLPHFGCSSSLTHTHTPCLVLFCCCHQYGHATPVRGNKV